MRIVGIDPGLTRCGVGIIDAGVARRVSLVHVGVIRTDAGAEPPRRLLGIYEALSQILSRYHPEVVAVERVFAQDNVRSVMGTAQAAGIAMMLAAKFGARVSLHSPSEVKAAVCGNGRASKTQIQTMVQRILGLDALIKPADASDALALAICHAWRGFGGADSMRAQYGGKNTLPVINGVEGITAAQRIWAQAERDSKRAGATAKRPGANRKIPGSKY